MPTRRLIPLFAALAAAAGCRDQAAVCSGLPCGTAVIVTTADASSMLPPLIDATIDAQISDQIFLKLADIGNELNTVGDSGFIPRLAASWKLENPLTLAFTLNPAARWADGVPVTAEDVAFTFDVYRDTLVNSIARPLLANIASVTARDDHTVVFRFQHRYPEQFYDATYHMRILPRHLLDTVPLGRLASHRLNRNPIGNGPYRMVAWRSNDAVELAADPDFFLGTPGLARVIWRITPSYPTAITQLVADQADLMEFLGTPENIQRVEAAPQLRAVQYPSPAYVYMGFNLSDSGSTRPHPLFGARALRRALAGAVDAKAVAATILGEWGEVPVGPASRLYRVGRDSTVARIPFDPAAARQELAALGWRDSDGDGILDRNGRRLAFDLVVPTSSELRMRAAVLLQEQFRRVGVTVGISALEFNLFRDRTTRGQFDAALLAWSDDPTPTSIRQTWTGDAVGRANYVRYRNPAVDRLVDQAANTFDAAAAYRLWRQVYGLINEDAAGVPLYVPANVAAVHRRFEIQLRGEQWTTLLWTWRVTPDQALRRDIGPPPAP